jgi:hypothetical protein
VNEVRVSLLPPLSPSVLSKSRLHLDESMAVVERNAELLRQKREVEHVELTAVRRSASSPGALADFELDAEGFGTFLGDFVLAPTDAIPVVRAMREMSGFEARKAAEVGHVAALKERHEMLFSFGVVESGPKARIAGVVLDELGSPVEGAVVAVWTGSAEHTARSDAEGRYSLDVPCQTELALFAGGDDEGIARKLVTVREEGAELSLDLVLERGLELRGVLKDAGGAPLANWQIELASDDPRAPWSDGTFTAEDGSFAIPNLPDAPASLLVRDPSAWHRLPALVVSSVRPGAGELALELPKGDARNAALEVALRDAAGAQPASSSVRVWQLASGRGAWLPLEQAGSYRVAGLPAGRYRVEAGASGLGWADGGDVWLAPGEQRRLETLELSAPSRLAVTLSSPATDFGGDLGWQLFRVSDDVLSLQAAGPLAEPFDGELAAGSYALRVTGARFAAHVFEAIVEPGESTVLELDLDDVRPALLRFSGDALRADPESIGDEPGAASHALHYRVTDVDGARTLLTGTLAPGESGAFELRAFLVPGEYRVVATLGEGEALEARFRTDAIGAGAVAVSLR